MRNRAGRVGSKHTDEKSGDVEILESSSGESNKRSWSSIISRVAQVTIDVIRVIREIKELYTEIFRKG